MKKIILATVMCSVAFSGFAADEDKVNSVKDKVSSAVAEIVSFGKNTLSGVNEGIDEGHRDGESVDGALIINDSETMNKYDFSIKISKVNKLSDTSYEFVMILRNNESKPVRLKNLTMPFKVILLDEDGIAVELGSGAPYQVTVPEKAAVRSNWTFYQVEAKPKTLRLYGKDMNITVPITEAAKYR